MRNCLPYCSGQKVGHGNDLASRNPKLAKEWHPTKNGKLTASDVMPGSGKKRWWLCNKGHDWEAVVSSRNNGSNCPYCSGQKVGHGNDLLSKNPEIAKYWHPTKNGTLKPSDVTPGSNKKVWWLCDNKHESYTTVSNKAGANKRKCKFCYFESRNQRFSNP